MRRRGRPAIGFAVRDQDGCGSAFEIDMNAGEALVFGSAGALRVSAPGVLPAHFVVLPHAGMLVAASASEEHPAFLEGAPLSTAWTILDVPSRIRLGGAAVDFFVVQASGAALVDVDVDVEETVAYGGDPGAPAFPRTAMTVTPMAPGLVARAGAAYVTMSWKNASTSTRVLLGVVAVLVVFLTAR